MPKVDMDMATGTVMVWHIAEGAKVERGEPLLDIETDKAAMEIEAPHSGILRHPLAVGSEVPIGKAIAWLYAEGEVVGPTPNETVPPTDVSVPAASPDPAPKATAPAASDDGLRATPLARKIAAENGIDLVGVRGTGPRGRICKADVLAAKGKLPFSAAEPMPAGTGPSASPAEPAAHTILQMFQGRDYEEVTLDGMRRTVATRLTEAKQTIPHFYLRREVEVDALLALRGEVNEGLAPRGIRLTVNDFIIRACAVALQRVPEANAAWAGDRILHFARSDLSVAVAVKGGIFTPVIRDADLKPLSAISAEMKALGMKARDRKLMPVDCTGGAFSISNLGMFGVDEFDAIVNPPQGAILAVGAGRKRMVVGEDEEARAATTMRLTLSVDHRMIDGALGADLLGAIVAGLERPMALLG